MSSLSAALDIFLAAIGLYIIKQILRTKHRCPLPPGPTGWPLVGNLFDFPSQNQFRTLASLGNKYGDVSSMKVLGNNIIILNSAQVASDILDKRSTILSGRPHLTVACDLSGWSKVFPLVQNNQRFRSYRTLFNRYIGSKSSLTAFHPAIEEEARKFVRNLSTTPNDLVVHIRALTGAIVLRISHGYSVQEGVDPFVDLADKAMANFSRLAAPGAFLVDALPILKHLPEWFPGTEFLQIAKENRQLVHEALTKPHQFVLDQLAAGNAFPSFTSKLVGGGVTPDEEDIVMWAAFSMYLGGSDTTTSSLYAFFLAMTIHPEIQKRGQAELDSVIGTNKLPTFKDRDSLPYVNAICIELLRWHAVVPLGVSHVCTEDTVYQGYLISKGSCVIANIWHILHDERTYPDPETFNPERFLGENTQADPRGVCFGYGRRKCPGAPLADTSIFMAISMSLAVLNISQVHENGVEVIPKLDPTDGVSSHPRPFRCKISPRSIGAKKLIDNQ